MTTSVNLLVFLYIWILQMKSFNQQRGEFDMKESLRTPEREEKPFKSSSGSDEMRASDSDEKEAFLFYCDENVLQKVFATADSLDAHRVLLEKSVASVLLKSLHSLSKVFNLLSTLDVLL
jgi:hypothetical protein